MRCTLAYGKLGLALDLPDSWDVTVLRKPRMPALGDPRRAVEACLDGPRGCGPLEQAARGARNACILVCDVTRPVPHGLVLRPIVERLLAGGIPADDVTVLVATGLHRPAPPEELDAIVQDPWVSSRARIVNHFARNDGDHVLVGTTRGGFPVRLDRRFVEADLRIGVGLVEPHFMAGWSGGRKLILPGIAHADTIRAFHSAAMLGHPRAATAVLDGNPLHEAQIEALAMSGPCLAMSLVIDEQRAACHAAFGTMEESHAAAVRFAEPFFRISVPRTFPGGSHELRGFPLDATYYQAVKGICCGASILEPGGELFVVSGCAEGFGSPEFRTAQERLHRLGPGRFRAEGLARPLALIDEWQTTMLLKARDAGAVHLFSEGLADSDHALTCVLRVQRLDDELRAAVERAPGRRLAVIPEGPYVAPEVRR